MCWTDASVWSWARRPDRSTKNLYTISRMDPEVTRIESVRVGKCLDRAKPSTKRMCRSERYSSSVINI